MPTKSKSATKVKPKLKPTLKSAFKRSAPLAFEAAPPIVDRKGPGNKPQKTAAPAVDPQTMPPALREQFTRLETWAMENLQDSRKDAFRFWMLKVPAIAGSAGAGILANFKMDLVALVLGAIGSFCILIDGLSPSGALRNTHLRAFHDLRNLQQNMLTQWEAGVLRSNGNSRKLNALAAELIESTTKETNRIEKYLSEMETALGTAVGTTKKDEG